MKRAALLTGNCMTADLSLNKRGQMMTKDTKKTEKSVQNHRTNIESRQMYFLGIGRSGATVVFLRGVV